MKILLAKGLLSSLRNPKGCLVGLLIAVLVISAVIMVPITMLQFIVIGDDEGEVIQKYQDFGQQHGIDWSEIIIYDYIRSEMDLSSINIADNVDTFVYIRLNLWKYLMV